MAERVFEELGYNLEASFHWTGLRVSNQVGETVGLLCKGVFTTNVFFSKVGLAYEPLIERSLKSAVDKDGVSIQSIDDPVWFDGTLMQKREGLVIGVDEITKDRIERAMRWYGKLSSTDFMALKECAKSGYEKSVARIEKGLTPMIENLYKSE